MDNHEDILDRFYQLFDSIYKVRSALVDNSEYSLIARAL